MLNKRVALLCSVLVFLSCPISAHAITVQYNLTALGGDSYRYDYILSNDGSLGAGVAVELLDIYFDPALYQESSLSIVTAPPLSDDWDEAIFASAPFVPAAYDLYALAGGIADGANASGFAVEFIWLGGPAGPGAQSYEIFDPLSFASLETGTTTVVPLPGAFWLALSGLLGLVRFARRKQRTTE